MRVCDMLGGAATDRVPSYYALSLGDPDDVARVAAAKIAEGLSAPPGEGGGKQLSPAAKAFPFVAVPARWRFGVVAGQHVATNEASM